MDLLRDQAPQQLQLADGLDPRQERADEARLDHLEQRVVLSEGLDRKALVVPADHLIHCPKLVDEVLVLGQAVPLLELRRHGAPSNIDAVVTIEGPQLAHQLVDDELVEAL